MNNFMFINSALEKQSLAFKDLVQKIKKQEQPTKQEKVQLSQQFSKASQSISKNQSMQTSIFFAKLNQQQIKQFKPKKFIEQLFQNIGNIGKKQSDCSMQFQVSMMKMKLPKQQQKVQNQDQQIEVKSNTLGELRVKKSKNRSLAKTKQVEKQQLLKLSFQATKLHKDQLRKLAEDKFSANIDFLARMRGRKLASIRKQWKQNEKLLDPLKTKVNTESNIQSKTRSGFSHHDKKLETTPNSTKLPSLKIPYQSYSMYKMYGKSFKTPKN